MANQNVDRKAFRSLSYGLYVISSLHEGAQRGCVANTFAQVTSSPAQVSVALNKENHTTQAILETGAFEASVLDETASMELIGTFGFHSGADTDKFAPYEWAESEQGLPYLTQSVCAHFSVKVSNHIDIGSHILFVGEVVEANVLSSETPMTYAYYHNVKGGKTPPKASSYNGGDDATGAAAPYVSIDAAKETPVGAQTATQKYAWRCTVCGHIEYVDELPDDFICPVCGVGKDMFERIVL